ncbi:MAG: hypothetical protein B5M48_03465 [Candidatus Omnitrophica bacterium 4484_213]|nr:MAG: hypothetical protein B5M48_03465 [Candidatus Omnitrophica bacterium 4484_213]
MTVSLWVKPKDIGNSHTQRLVTLGTDAGGGNKYWEFSINGLDKAMFTVYDSAGSPFSIQSDSKLLVDAWYHLTGVYDYGDGTNGQMRLYVNGASGADPVSCTGGIKIWDGGAKFTVGFKDDGTADGAEHFTGLLDEVSVWNKALTAPQVSTLYNQSLAAVTGYVSSGTYISALKDVGAAIALGTNLKWGNISWIAELPGSDTVKFQIASDNDAVPTDYIGPQGSVNDYYSSTQNVDSWGQSVHNTHRFLKYKAVLSGSGATTPILSAVDIAYSCLYGLVGQKTFTNAVKFSAAGNKTVTATATGLTDGAQTVSVQKPDYFTITSDGTGIAGASENFTVTAYMRVGEDSVKVQVYKGAKQIEMRVANYPAGFAAPKYNGTEISTTADWTSFNVEFAAGEATLPITFYGAGDGISVLVKATDITEGSASINISNAAANKIEFSGDIGEQIAGAGFNLPVLKVLDEYGNLCADYTYSGTGAKTVTYTLSGDSHVSDSWTTSVEFSQGLSTTVLATTLCKAQSTTITAEISPLTADTSNQFEVKPADPASIELTQQPDSPHYVMAPLSPAPIVTIKDVYGNTCTNAAGNVSITADPAHLEGTASVALSNGVATFTDLKYTQLTTAVLTADYSDLTPVDFDPITFIVAGEAVLTVDGITQSSTILSSKNTFAERSEVFKFKVTDGGVDLLPVKVTKLVINRGASDTDDWTNYIPAGKAYLYIEDASGNKVKELTGGIVTADKITFGDTTYELFSVPNGGERTISLKIYLKNSLPANADGKQFYFETSCSDISLDSMGSSFGEATTTVHNDPYLDVKASKFIIRKADDGASEISITAGTPVNIKINAVDENGNIDKTGFTGIKEIYFSGAQVSPAPASKSPTCSGIDFGLPTSIAFVDGEAASVEMIIYNAAVSYIKAYTEAIPLENSLSGDALRAAVSAGPGVALAWDKPFWDEQTDAESASITAVLISKAVWPVFEVKIIDDYGNTDVNAAETTIAVSSTLCSGTSGAVTSAGIANFDDFAVDCGGVVSTTLNLNATGGDFTPVQSNDIIVKEKYGIELKILDSTTGTKLSGVNLSVFTANMQGVSVSISGANPFTFELPYKSGGYIFQTSKDAYVDATVSQTTDSQTDGKDGTYDGQISSIAFMTSILEAKSDYHVLGDFVYDEDTDTLSIYVRLEKKGKQIKSDVVNMLKGVTLEIVDPALSGAGRTIESLSKGITELVNKGKGDYWFEIKNAVGSGKFKSGKVYLANMAITYGPRSKDYPGDLTDEEKAGLGLSEADIEDMGLNVLYTAADTFEIGVAARLKVWTGEIREEVAGVKETVSLEAGVTRGKIEDVKSDVSGLKGAVATEAETTREKVADVHTEAVSILEDTATTIPAFLTTIEQKVGAQILNRETSVKSGETITIRYRTDSGLSPEIDVYDANNVQRVTDGTMTEIDSTGVYEYDVKFLSRWGKGDYTIVCSESTQGTVDSMTLSVLSADIESVSQDVSATLAMKDTSALEDRISALESRVNQILGRLTGKIGGGISVERRVVEVVTKPIYTEIKTISKALKEIGASEEYGLKPIYEVSEKSAEDVVYLKNKTLELKAVADVTRELVGRLNDKPIVRTWMEIAK